MAEAYLVVQRAGKGTCDILLAQKNLYLTPTGKRQYATIASHAVQYVLPGGPIQPGEQSSEAAVRELFEGLGVQVPVSGLHLLLSDSDQNAFYKVLDPGIDIDAINASLANRNTLSPQYNNALWVPIEEAFGCFGHKEEHKNLPWVMPQILRALDAGFSKEVIGMRANESSTPFSCAVAKLILDTYGSASQSPCSALAPPANASGTCAFLAPGPS